MNVPSTPVSGAAPPDGEKALKPPAGRNPLPACPSKSAHPQKSPVQPSKTLPNSPPKSKSSPSTPHMAALLSPSSPGSPPVQSSKPPKNSPPKSKSLSSPLAGHPLKGNPGSSSGGSAGGRPVKTRSMVKMRQWLKGRRPWICRCTLSAGFAAVAVAILILVNVRKDLIYPEARRPRPRLMCAQASQSIRASLNYALDPCDDFYSFVCGAGDHNASERRVYLLLPKSISTTRTSLTSTLNIFAHCRSSTEAMFGDGGQAVWDEIQRALEDIPWRSEKQGPENKAARYYRSCRRFIAAPTIDVKEHAHLLFKTVPEMSGKILQAALDSPARILELLVSVFVKRGISALFFFSPGNGTMTLTGLRPPLSAYLDELSLHLVLLDVAAILGIPDSEATQAVKRLLLVDYELLIASSAAMRHLSRASLSASSAGNRTKTYGEDEAVNDGVVIKSDETGVKRPSFPVSRDHDIIGTFLPAEKYTVETTDVEALRRVLRALFIEMSKTEIAVYLLTYMLLPDEMLLVFANKKDETVCYRLLEFVYRDVWGDLATLMSLAQRHTGPALLVTETVLSSLRNSLLRRGTHDLTLSTRNTIAELLLEVSRKPEALNWTALNSLRNTNVRSLYSNVIGLEHPKSPPKSTTQNESIAFEVNYPKLRIPRERLVPPFYCHGKYRFLNYATFGVSVAREVLGILDGSFLGADAPHSSPSDAFKKDVRSCFANAAASLDQSVTREGKLLDELTSWAAGLQVALAASELERSMPQHHEVVEPAMMQTFFARYCYHLCQGTRNSVFRTHERSGREVKYDSIKPRLKDGLSRKSN
ncbi:hypothetical protein HPB48_020585 [Haemaphysalis longicornis]|uniref:Peptidase M13 N-terminal domain-containing protein n=1 Tax=Haemaphysalis longicornis TaxID=44386 RepID=A0A9J6FTB4_HAELO|nr:hypothetical protein HPB48_020585 [Haemaphysalis longicornis]